MRKLTRCPKQAQVVGQYVSYRLLMEIIALMVLTFYYIHLYQVTGRIDVLILERVFVFIGLGLGVFSFSFLIDRFGYLKSYKLSYWLQFFTYIGLFFLIDDIAELFHIFGFIRGFANGTFWPIHNVLQIKELHGRSRERLMYTIQSLIQVSKIIIPVTAGAFITISGEFKYALLLAAVVILVINLGTSGYNRVPKSKIRSSEVTRILKNKNFGSYFLVNFLNLGTSSLMMGLWLIIPYLLIGSEFGVGVLFSFFGVVAALFAIYERNKPTKHKYRLGVYGLFFFGLVDIVFALIWTLPMMTLRALIWTVVSSVFTPIQSDLFNRISEKLLGDFKNESAVELIIVYEMIAVFSRVVALLSVYILLRKNGNDASDLIRIVIGVLAFYRVVVLIASRRLDEKLKI